jgi:hypothetical protein
LQSSGGDRRRSGAGLWDRFRWGCEQGGGDRDVLFVGDGGVVLDGGDEVREGAGDGPGRVIGAALERTEERAAVGEDEGEQQLGLGLAQVDEGAQRAWFGGGGGLAVADQGHPGQAQADRSLELGALDEAVAAEDRHADAGGRRGRADVGGGCLGGERCDECECRLACESRRARQRQQGRRDRRPRWGHGGPRV